MEHNVSDIETSKQDMLFEFYLLMLFCSIVIIYLGVLIYNFVSHKYSIENSDDHYVDIKICNTNSEYNSSYYSS